jgi:hypothetical protein
MKTGKPENTDAVVSTVSSADKASSVQSPAGDGHDGLVTRRSRADVPFTLTKDEWATHFQPAVNWLGEELAKNAAGLSRQYGHAYRAAAGIAIHDIAEGRVHEDSIEAVFRRIIGSMKPEEMLPQKWKGIVDQLAKRFAKQLPEALKS